MSKYTFTFRKDDISVEFTTTDKEVVANQFKIWVDDATEYTKNHPAEEKKTLDSVEKQQSSQKNEEIKPVPAPVQPEPASTDTFEPQENIKSEQAVEKVQPQAEPNIHSFEKASELLKNVETTDINQQAVVDSVVQETKTPENIEQKIESQTIVEPQEQQTPPVTINSIQNPELSQPEVPDFDKVLEQKIENSTFEPSSNKDNRFIDFVNAKNTRDKLHYLIITAFYFLQFDRIERFSLKQINSKLMHNISELIDHTVIQDAMNCQLIEIVPDLTGASEVSEYRLTEKGEDFFINGLN